jgi:HD-GYP domain-containing protein (c-di-GMP phosphodiesterase class II)
LADSLAYIRERSGKQFDPKVVAAFLDEVAEEYAESQDSA